jgi:hypothetical protein
MYKRQHPGLLGAVPIRPGSAEQQAMLQGKQVQTCANPTR